MRLSRARTGAAEGPRVGSRGPVLNSHDLTHSPVCDPGQITQDLNSTFFLLGKWGSSCVTGRLHAKEKLTAPSRKVPQKKVSGAKELNNTERKDPLENVLPSKESKQRQLF